MIEESFLICQKVSDDLNVNYDLIKSINDIIFKELAKKIRTPTSLIVSVQPLGNFYYRDKKTSYKLEHIREEGYGVEEFKTAMNSIIDMYKDYKEDKLNFKYDKFGKESHESYLLDKKQKKLLTTKKDKSK